MQARNINTSFGNVDPALWADWKWQLKNRITSTEGLKKFINLSDSEERDINICLSSFRMAITPYYASLINPFNPQCPIRKQSIPTADEIKIMPYELEDPLNEEGDSPVKHIVHRYPDRVLFLLTYKCSMYCRHCTRKRMVGEEDISITNSEVDDAIHYIKSNTAIRDVLLSGGDPLTLSDNRLEYIISRLRTIPHVEIIRIGTRVPVVLPMRITPDLLNMLKKYHPIWINTHFNHPYEITEQSSAACMAIVDAGIPLGNQSVLLKGINDDFDTMKSLLLTLVKHRIRPYYLYQCDLTRGLSHFRTSVNTGVELTNNLTGSISGFAVPRFVIDAPNGGGKIPVNPEYMVSIDDECISLRNYLDKIYTYPNID